MPSDCMNIWKVLLLCKGDMKMYQYINTRMLLGGCAVLYRFEGKYQIDVFLSNGNAPVHNEKFDYVSEAKAWRENNAQAYVNK